MTDTDHTEYSLQLFAPEVDGEETDSRTGHWFEAVYFGFHDGTPEPASLAKFAASYQQDGRVLSGMYADRAAEGAWSPDVPVATYGTLPGELNVGAGSMLRAHLITAVTVRPTHRRRGLLRRMITEDLVRAKGNGLAMAALTASEATIYGRFGFGAATFTRTIELDVKERFGLSGTPSGTVEVAGRAALLERASEIFDQFHRRTFGSMSRQHSYRYRVSGAWSDQKAEEDKRVRVAFHYDDGGVLDGYVSYKFAGWDTQPYTVKVIDLVAATETAYLELWRYLGAIDLVERVTFEHAGQHDPLPWALSDRRGYKITDEEDVLWLRVLDPVEALTSRHYWADGAVVLRIDDPLDLAAGTYRLRVRDGQAEVARLDDGATADVVLNVSALGSLYLGGVSALTLAAAGQIAAVEPGKLEVLDAIFASPQAPYCITHF